MIRLRQTKGADAGREFEFDKSLVRIGRMPDSDVDFDPETDLDASGRHAEVRHEGRQYLLIDAGSRNGTWLNGERVKHAVLKEGDELEFGKGGPVLVVVTVTQEAASKSPLPPRPTSGKVVKAEPAIVPETVTHRLVSEEVDLLATNPTATMPREIAERGPRPGDATGGDFGFEFPPIGDGNAQPAKSWRKGRKVDSRWVWFVFGLFFVAGIAAVGVWRQLNTTAEPRVGESTGALSARIQSSVVYIRLPEGDPCAAFYVRDKIAVTTARCVAGIQKAAASSSKVAVTLQGGKSADIVRMWRHPKFVAVQPSLDVALVELDQSGSVLSLAAVSPGSLKAGDAIHSVDQDGRMISTAVESLERFGGDDADSFPAMIHRGAAIRGAPIVDESGEVVGVQSGKLPSDTSGLYYAVRSDMAQGLLAGLEQ